LSEELKKLLREIELARGLQAGALREEIESKFRGVTEPLVEKLKEVLREEIRVLEERFPTKNPGSREEGMVENQTLMKNGADRKSADDAPVEPGRGRGGSVRTEAASTDEVTSGRKGIYVPEADHTLRTVPVPNLKRLRSRENEAVRQFKYVDELCAELELAVLRGNSYEVKCQRRALTSGLQVAEEAIMRTAEGHKWTKATLDRALDIVRGLALPRREEADQFLREEEQEQRSRWMNDCQKMAQNAIILVSQATRPSPSATGLHRTARI
jgi:hypothetical protein